MYWWDTTVINLRIISEWKKPEAKQKAFYSPITVKMSYKLLSIVQVPFTPGSLSLVPTLLPKVSEYLHFCSTLLPLFEHPLKLVDPFVNFCWTVSLSVLSFGVPLTLPGNWLIHGASVAMIILHHSSWTVMCYDLIQWWSVLHHQVELSVWTCLPLHITFIKERGHIFSF